MTAVDILIFIAKHKVEFSNLKRYSPVQVLARMPEKDELVPAGRRGAESGAGRGEVGISVAHWWHTW